MRFFILLTLCSLAISEISFAGQRPLKQDEIQEPKKQVANFQHHLFAKVKEYVNFHPGLTNKKELIDVLNQLENSKVYIKQGSDDELRAIFVHLQAGFEQVIASFQAFGEITDLIGIIHTPTPATPLCTLPKESSLEGLLDPSVKWDQSKLLTIRSRAQIIHDYLSKGCKLYAVYPKGGFEKRTLEQQQIYLSNLQKFKENLFDTVLTCSEMNPDKVGATYIFKQGKTHYSFSIKSLQANATMPISEWGLWFGEITEEPIKKRLEEVLTYLSQYNGPNFQARAG